MQTSQPFKTNSFLAQLDLALKLRIENYHE